MSLPGKKGKLFKRRKVPLFSQNHPFSTTAISQLLQKSGFFRIAGKHQVNIETGGGGSAEIQYNSWNRFPTNPHSDGSESMPTDGDAAKSTALTATNELDLPTSRSRIASGERRSREPRDRLVSLAGIWI
jgi:hypothetical protein